MKKFLKVLITIISILTIIIGINFMTANDKVYADVGNFKSYSSSGSRSSSSSSSSSRRSSSGSSYSSSSSTLGNIGLIMFAIRHPWIFLLIIGSLAIWRALRKKFGNNPNIKKYNEAMDKILNPDFDFNFGNNNNNRSAQSEESVLSSVKAIDPNFNPEEFKAFARDVYIRLQAAWSKGDWEDIRTFESNELFEQHRNQLQEYLDKGQLNKMDRVGVLNERYSGFRQQAGKDVLEIDLDVKQIDYIIDSKTKQIVIGDPNEEDYGTYRLTFSGKCPYCGSVITTTDYGWVLSNLSKIS